MKPGNPQPPALALWLLLHLRRRPDRESLAGDLLEQYVERRSPGWFWKEVAVAILTGLRSDLAVRQRDAVFASAGTALIWAIPWRWILPLSTNGPLRAPLFAWLAAIEVVTALVIVATGAALRVWPANRFAALSGPFAICALLFGANDLLWIWHMRDRAPSPGTVPLMLVSIFATLLICARLTHLLRPRPLPA
jgi:hypothetical protein